jgi:hypothetical protein
MDKATATTVEMTTVYLNGYPDDPMAKSVFGNGVG